MENLHCKSKKGLLPKASGTKRDGPERWPSGRRRSPAKGVDGQPSRGFESLPLRHFPFPIIEIRLVCPACGVERSHVCGKTKSCREISSRGNGTARVPFWTGRMLLAKPLKQVISGNLKAPATARTVSSRAVLRGLLRVGLGKNGANL